MDLRAKTDDCLILRGRDYNESDRLLIVFGEKSGKMSCLAKGVRRANSRLKAGTQLFSYSTLTFAATKGTLNLITQSEPKNVHAEIRSDLTKIAVASYMAELLDVVLPENKPQKDIFVLTEAMLALLAADADCHLVLACFRLRLLSCLGYRLNFSACAACGAAAASYEVNPTHGGLLCPVCAAKLAANRQNYHQNANGAVKPVSVKISAGTARLLESLAEWDLRRLFSLKISSAMQAEVDLALTHLLNFYIGRAAKAAADNLSVYM